MNTDDWQCPHVEDFKAGEGSKTFKIIHAVFVTCTDEDARTTKLNNAFCHVCKRLGPLLHACLHCVFFGCHEHIREHTWLKNNHYFSIDLSYGQVHCRKCDDYIYDTELEEIALENKLNSEKLNKRLMRVSWDPSERVRDFLTLNSKKIFMGPDSIIGLRGLVNLGSTCFMNCIIQALMHTPLLRDYFLSERHKCKGIAGTCLVCELNWLFQEFYKGQRVPLALNKLLHMIWTQCQHLAGYEQQDAHEFFIATLNVLHQHCLVALGITYPPKDCPCIIDQIFTGGLQSDVVCQKCNGVSTTIDPVLDFSLDLGSVTVEGKPPASLIDCLEHFTRPEPLGSSAKIMCSNCKSKQESTKQLTIKTLPIVISFHLKRFQHKEKIERKILFSISFPEMLDMTPFMTQESKDNIIPADNRYSLFAVINHIGSSVNVGHYIAYVRQQRDFWYKCDDHVIKRVHLQEVLDSEGYLLFYHKHILGYE